MVPVIPTGTKSPEEADGAKETPSVEAAAVAVTIAETTQSLNTNLKENERWSDFQINNYKNGHRATQYKKIVDTLPVLCADKNYQGIDDVLCNGIKPVEN
mmetsp:Transcript_51994/g.58075  ORF Transcript_51994/g.58075 Transcript_51994/m.58075 type:complete len:100 (-) Transcript_51994:52-351(-)